MFRLFSGLACFLMLSCMTVAADPPGSIGVQVVPVQSGELVVIAVIRGSSADIAGILPGDLLVQIDDLVLRGSDFQHIAKAVLPGATGTSVLLTWMRPGEPGTRSTRLKRLPIDAKMLPSVVIPAAGPR